MCRQAEQIGVARQQVSRSIVQTQDRLLQADRTKAQALRDKCRGLFMHYLARGYVVNDFVLRKSPDGRRRAYYRLDQEIQWQTLNL